VILVMGFWTFLRAVFFGSAAIALENVALRHQLLVFQRSVRRPRCATNAEPRREAMLQKG
jgi:hypothetical protein